MSTEPLRHALNGPTMGTRWSALFFTPADFDAAPLQTAMQMAVAEVDDQMSSWKPDSDLMRINRAPPGEWIAAPAQLLAVLRLGGAFDVGMGDAVTAWGFGPDAASGERIRIALQAPRRPSWEAVEIGEAALRKHEAITLDLNGIAKGHGVDRLAETMLQLGSTSQQIALMRGIRSSGTMTIFNNLAISISLSTSQQSLKRHRSSITTK